MKAIKYIALAVIILLLLYAGAIFTGFNLPKPAFLEDKGIEGNAELKVTLLMDNSAQNPLPNIEVDVAEKPGQPPKGGVAVSDDQGVATFMIKPGNYYIYFNDSTFPKNLSVPQPELVTVTENAVNQKTLLITTSK